MTDILIIPITGTIDFTNNAGEVMRMSGSGDPQAELQLSGSSGSIASFKDSFEDTLFSVTDQSQLPLFEVLPDQRIKAYGPIVAKTYQCTFHNYHTTDGGQDYIPINLTTESGNIADNQTGWMAPTDGELVEVIAYAENAAGSTQIEFYTNENTTPIETETVDMVGAKVPYVFSFSISTFSKGDTLHVSMDPANTGGSTRIVCTWLFNWRTL